MCFSLRSRSQNMNERIASITTSILASGTVFGVVTLTNLELILKIVLLVITIGFTGYQFQRVIRKDIKKDIDDE
jgi:hypothetical protein